MQYLRFSSIISKIETVGGNGARRTIRYEEVQKMKYDFASIEPKWQKKWLEEKTFHCENHSSDKPKFYALVEFPYPSGQGLHVGHARPYTAMDSGAQTPDGWL